MASSFDTFKELNLTHDEVERLTDALKDKKFRQLLADYVDEVKDPENQKLYQQEITQLEKERGVDVTFINPVAGYVIKTSVNGSKKAFINICANEHIRKPSSNPAVQEGARGLQWKLPHSLAPPREDMDNKGVRCQVYDVVFHPDTLHLAQKNKAFRVMVNNTACDAVEANYDVVLDRKNLKFPKLQYKGFPQAAVIRKTSDEQPSGFSEEDKEFMDKFYAQVGAGAYPPAKPEAKSPKKLRKSPKKGGGDQNSEYTTPKYVMKHRRHVELDEFTEHKSAKMLSATPKELVVEVNLPLLKSSADIVLDVAEKTLQLTSEKPAKYKLALSLPYRVNQDAGNAKFDKDQKKLVVVLPLKTSKGLVLTDAAKDDSGVDSDHGSVTSSSPVEEVDPTLSNLITEIRSEQPHSLSSNAIATPIESTVQKSPFLDPNLHYSLPEFTSHLFERTIAFTLNVKNVDETSITKIINQPTASDLHVKFSSISSGFYPQHYAFYVRLPNHTIATDKLSIEAWDNNVIVQINYLPCDTMISSYLFGPDAANLTEKYFEEPSIINEALQGSVHSPSSSYETGKKPSEGAGLLEIETNDEDDDRSANQDGGGAQSSAIDIVGAFSESSGDEISYSLSPSKARGILKGFSKPRRFGRSISESGLDDVAWSSSIENCHTSVDSVIPEEGEMSTSLKKTVRFNDVVSRQLFRSNSSILGQRKKNQRRAKAKKRAQERRHSEGEVSETEDKKERDAETGDECESENKENGDKSGSDEKHYFASDIFELDMNF